MRRLGLSPIYQAPKIIRPHPQHTLTGSPLPRECEAHLNDRDRVPCGPSASGPVADRQVLDGFGDKPPFSIRPHLCHSWPLMAAPNLRSCRGHPRVRLQARPIGSHWLVAILIHRMGKWTGEHFPPHYSDVIRLGRGPTLARSLEVAACFRATPEPLRSSFASKLQFCLRSNPPHRTGSSDSSKTNAMKALTKC